MLIKMIERKLVYPRPSRERGDWRPRWLRPQNVWFRSGDNTKLHGWYVPNPDAQRLIVYSHGNREHVADQASLVIRLQTHLQATVFLYDYRGYGRSRGNPYERGCVADGMAAQRWLAEKEGVGTEDIIMMGRSLGGGVSVAAAAEQGARALVLEATFSRMTDAAAHQFPWLPVRLVMRNRYNSMRRIKKYTGPTFQSHGTDDEVVPLAMARSLFDTSPSRLKEFYEINFARHNDTPPPAYYTALSAFLDRVDEQSAAKTPARLRRRKRQLVS
jgi:fermentation-respiration switch protein FrsA (DUF1100 family)